MMTNFDRRLKRVFDFSLSLIGLFLSSILIFISWIVSSIDTSSNGLFTQQRIGEGGRPFTIFKIKTMVKVVGVDVTITSSGDVRITKIGAFFRRTKIDELPQLWNVLLGQMSFVGPRPDIVGYADKLVGDDRAILAVRPGITGPAQIAYRDEEELLADQSDSVSYNDDIIWPDKVRINREYVENYSFFKDLYYIWTTILGGYA